MPLPGRPASQLIADNPSKVPILTEGRLTPRTFANWKTACKAFFATKGVDENDQVKVATAGIRLIEIRNYVEAEAIVVNLMNFDHFARRVREIALEPGWEAKERDEIETCVQGERKIMDFYYDILSKNELLTGTPYHLSPVEIRMHMNAHLDKDLARMVNTEEIRHVATVQGIDAWLKKLQAADEVCRNNRQLIAEMMSKERRSGGIDNKRVITNTNLQGGRNHPSTSRPTTVNQYSAKGQPSFTRLSDGERQLLLRHNGCFKCRHFYTNHLSFECTLPSNLQNRKVLTDAEGLKVRPPNMPPLPPLFTRRPIQARVNALSDITQFHPQLPAHAVAQYGQGHPTDRASVTDENTGLTEPDEDPETHDQTVTASAVYAGYDSSDSEYVAPLSMPQIFWPCTIQGPKSGPLIETTALIDNGSSLVLIDEKLAKQLTLKHFTLKTPICVSLAIDQQYLAAKQKKKNVQWIREYVLFAVGKKGSKWKSKILRAAVTSNLCAPLILGLPFLHENKVTIDHEKLRVFISNPMVELVGNSKDKESRENNTSAAVVQTAGALQKQIAQIESELRKMYHDLFRDEIYPVHELPPDPVHSFKLIDPNKTIKARQYSCPRKFREAWDIILKQHLQAGRIVPSASSVSSPAFLIPKSDPLELPRMVIDSRELNANTVPDNYPLPRVDDILAACARSRIFGKIDLSQAFHQTLVQADQRYLTAFTTPLGMFEWTVMPMGLRNAPATHQRRMTMALQGLHGHICYVYLDDIIIWAEDIPEYLRRIHKVLQALRKAKLVLSRKKTVLISDSLSFLGHKIDSDGIHVDTSKMEKLSQWPVPKSASDVRSFLGLLRYVSAFIPDLASHTAILHPLTSKEAEKRFPVWTPKHQKAFQSIRKLVLSPKCLTSIDHFSPGENKIFLHTDASDTRTGACLSFGSSPDKARPVGYFSQPLKGAHLNYTVGEKELLAIVRAVKKFRSDLIGEKFTILTDHKPLQHFLTQKDLSRRQARWQETLSDYVFDIQYVPGSQNTVADALSRLPNVASLNMSITTDEKVLQEIKNAYPNDSFCLSLLQNPDKNLGFRVLNGLLFYGERLVIPNKPEIREAIFKLAHDDLGHFGIDKAYSSLAEAYYWPNMRKELEKKYIPSCEACQRNKSSTNKTVGPLHPLPIADHRFDTVAIDFVGPLPEDEGYNYLCTMSDQLNADVRLVPCHKDISAKEFAQLFFSSWYNEHGLPLNIVSDRDHLFLSSFWKELHKITGITLKMSTAFHPQTDGMLERTNKTVIQTLRFSVDRQQKGWVKALPMVRFCIMNTVNKSTGFSPFQLLYGHSPRMIPPLTTTPGNCELSDPEQFVKKILENEQLAKDTLLIAKRRQTQQANKFRKDEIKYKPGEFVMLSTLHRRRDYMQKGDDRVAKFMARWDGKYKVLKAFPDTSTYKLLMPNQKKRYATFHSSLLKPFIPNDETSYPSCVKIIPPPVLTADGEEEWTIENILDRRKRGRGYQYLVRWAGQGPEDDLWLPAKEVKDCEALDRFEEKNGRV